MPTVKRTPAYDRDYADTTKDGGAFATATANKANGNLHIEERVIARRRDASQHAFAAAMVEIEEIGPPDTAGTLVVMAVVNYSVNWSLHVSVAGGGVNGRLKLIVEKVGGGGKAQDERTLFSETAFLYESDAQANAGAALLQVSLPVTSNDACTAQLWAFGSAWAFGTEWGRAKGTETIDANVQFFQYNTW